MSLKLQQGPKWNVSFAIFSVLASHSFLWYGFRVFCYRFTTKHHVCLLYTCFSFSASGDCLSLSWLCCLHLLTTTSLFSLLLIELFYLLLFWKKTKTIDKQVWVDLQCCLLIILFLLTWDDDTKLMLMLLYIYYYVLSQITSYLLKQSIFSVYQQIANV